MVLCKVSSWKREMAIWVSGIGIGAIIIIAIFVGLRLGGIDAFSKEGNSDDESKCSLQWSPCENPNPENGTGTCCFPLICSVRIEEMENHVSSDRNNSAGGICILEGENSTVPTSETSPTSGCPYSTNLEDILTTVRNGTEFEKTLEFYKSAKEDYLRLSAFRGDSKRNYLLAARELNLETRKHIRSTTDNVGRNIFPLIVANDFINGFEGVGGTFTLYLEDGSSQTVNPVSEEYEIRKGISHVPLGIYGILVPYFKMEHSSGWRSSLTSFRTKLEATLEATRISFEKDGGEHFELYENSLNILKISSKFISKWLREAKSSYKYGAPRTITVKQFEEYSQKIYPFLERSVKKTAEIQMKDVIPVLKRWKEELGEEKWKQVYAVIPTIWPVSGINPRYQALAEVMGPTQAKNQIFILENVGSSVESLRGILGKIIGHRVAAQLIFGTRTQGAKELTYGLSGRQDIMSNAAEDFINTLYHN